MFENQTESENYLKMIKELENNLSKTEEITLKKNEIIADLNKKILNLEMNLTEAYIDNEMKKINYQKMENQLNNENQIKIENQIKKSKVNYTLFLKEIN